MAANSSGPQKIDSFGTHKTLDTNGTTYHFHSLPEFAKKTGKNLSKMPFSLRVLLENLLRQEDGIAVRKADIDGLAAWSPKAVSDKEIQFMPARILLQDFTGVPAVADLAAMRGAIGRLGGDPAKINPLQPADLVIDHSVQVDFAGTSEALKKNADLEFERNEERYQFLRWGQNAFENFSVVPPDTGIVHQVNLEFLSHVAMTSKKADGHWIYPDSLVGTDSHTTMINGLGVVGWGVGGIEAEAAMLGQPITMLIPEVVGFRLEGALPAGTTATDLVLTVTQMLRKRGVVGKFVEFFGPGLSELTLADRATLANMAPEYGATVGIFPVDVRTTDYLKLTGRPDKAQLTEAYYKAQGMWFDATTPEPEYSDTLVLDMKSVVPCLAGPARPQDRVSLPDVVDSFRKALPALLQQKDAVDASKTDSAGIGHGSVVIAAITSCTNTSNPSGLIAAGLLAKNAVERGLTAKPFVKTSLAPGSKVVTDYLVKAGLLPYLEKLGFYVVGYGCTTCIGNSGPIPESIVKSVKDNQLAVAAVLSGNRNFEGRIHPNVRANYLASPALVVAYSIAGSVQIDLTRDALGKDPQGKDITLKDIWPTQKQVSEWVTKAVTAELFKKGYSDVFTGDQAWQDLSFPREDLYEWNAKSTYIKEPPFFSSIQKDPAPLKDIHGAAVLAMLGDSVTTDHISPAGSIEKDGPAWKYLVSEGVAPKDFNSYGSRRGNHEVMMRGTFANVRLKNFLVPGVEGGFTVKFDSNGKPGPKTSIFEAAMNYAQEKRPLIILAGKEYGTGSSRDWAAKGTLLLGVRAVITESFERIHRSNLIGMGVLPLQFESGKNAASLGLKGDESFEILGLNKIEPGQSIKVRAKSPSGSVTEFNVRSRIDTLNEAEYYRHGGILPYVLRQTLKG